MGLIVVTTREEVEEAVGAGKGVEAEEVVGMHDKVGVGSAVYAVVITEFCKLSAIHHRLCCGALPNLCSP